jgi:hypothetical protein
VEIALALRWKVDEFHDRLASWNEQDLDDLARLLAQLNES